MPSVAVEIPAAPAASAARPRVHFLDGIRGLAALYVTFHHAYMNLNWQGDGGGLSPGVLRACAWMQYGFYGVAVFIVLSGYCLMMPVARRSDGVLRGGFGGYMFRRAKRILPPYYAALVLSLLLIWLVPALSHQPSFFAGAATPVTFSGVAAHLLMVHNFQPAWFTRIDPPMWSIPIEFQIYLVFPALLLPAWRKFGIAGAAIAGVLTGYAIHHFSNARFDYSRPFFVSLFAFGTCAAAIACSSSRQATMLKKVPWLLVAPVALAAMIAIQHDKGGWINRHFEWMDQISLGVAVAALLAAAASEGFGGHALRRIVEARWLVDVGIWSYSLYLIHYPVLALINLLALKICPTPDGRLGLLVFVGIPVSCAIAYAFHRVFERPFMDSLRKAAA